MQCSSPIQDLNRYIFSKNAPPKMLDRVLNAPLILTIEFCDLIMYWLKGTLMQIWKFHYMFGFI